MHDPKETAERMYSIRGKKQALQKATEHKNSKKDIRNLCDWDKVIELLNNMEDGN